MEKQIHRLLAYMGTPLIPNDNLDVKQSEIKEIYELALKNRMGLYLLNKYSQILTDDFLVNEYKKLRNRNEMTQKVITKACNLLDKHKIEYVLFKSLKPYLATPNDTDILIFGNKKQFKNTLKLFYLENYIKHEIAPLQTTICDPRGKEFIGPKKKGGTYYIDVYFDIGTDYFAYINKNKIRPYVERTVIDHVSISNLKPEIELAILMFHNVFPERTFQLEHFYLPLFYLSKYPNFDIDLFWSFIKNQHLEYAVNTNLTLVNHLHRKVFNNIPKKLQILSNGYSPNYLELEKWSNTNYDMPYLFSPKTFWKSFSQKLKDSHASKSLVIQFLHMLSPPFFFDVLKSLKLRFSAKGAYQQEI